MEHGSALYYEKTVWEENNWKSFGIYICKHINHANKSIET